MTLACKDIEGLHTKCRTKNAFCGAQKFVKYEFCMQIIVRYVAADPQGENIERSRAPQDPQSLCLCDQLAISRPNFIQSCEFCFSLLWEKPKHMARQSGSVARIIVRVLM